MRASFYFSIPFCFFRRANILHNLPMGQRGKGTIFASAVRGWVLWALLLIEECFCFAFWIIVRLSSLSQYPDTLLGGKHLWSRHQWSLTGLFPVNDNETIVPRVTVPVKCQPLTCARLQINCIPLTSWGCLSGLPFFYKQGFFLFFIQTWILLKTQKGLWLQRWVWTSEWCHWSVWSLEKLTRRIFVSWPVWGCFPDQGI